jgi:DNA modification methylase
VTIHYADESVTLHHGDCRQVLDQLEAASVDAVVCDPPYELGFMGRSWDRSGVAFDPATWAGVLRVAKPGAHLLAFGGSRTFHRIGVAIEDGGWEVRDTLSWLYGSGFPKSLDVSKALDKLAGAERTEVVRERRVPRGHAFAGATYGNDGSDHRDYQERAPVTGEAAAAVGWGTALKPAWEPVVLARKPLTGTVAQTWLEHGTGAINIDGCRLPSSEYGTYGIQAGGPHDAGRWPANVVLDEVAAAALDAVADAPSRFFYCPKASADEKPWDARSHGNRYVCRDCGHGQFHSSADGCPKCGGTFADRRGEDAAAEAETELHPTVKPLALMRWLVRLVTPPGGVVLDPFAGTGTTGEAAIVEGARAVLVEAHAPYLKLIKARLSRPIQPTIGGL